jgi:hypothetical protein
MEAVDGDVAFVGMIPLGKAPATTTGAPALWLKLKAAVNVGGVNVMAVTVTVSGFW